MGGVLRKLTVPPPVYTTLHSSSSYLVQLQLHRWRLSKSISREQELRYARLIPLQAELLNYLLAYLLYKFCPAICERPLISVIFHVVRSAQSTCSSFKPANPFAKLLANSKRVSMG